MIFKIVEVLEHEKLRDLQQEREGTRLSNFKVFCQAQFQLASQVTSLTEISFKFYYYHPPGKVEMQLEIGHIYG